MYDHYKTFQENTLRITAERYNANMKRYEQLLNQAYSLNSMMKDASLEAAKPSKRAADELVSLLNELGCTFEVEFKDVYGEFVSYITNVRWGNVTIML